MSKKTPPSRGRGPGRDRPGPASGPGRNRPGAGPASGPGRNRPGSGPASGSGRDRGPGHAPGGDRGPERERKPGEERGSGRGPERDRKPGSGRSGGRDFGRPVAAERISPFTPQSFIVDGLAAVAEYIRFRPDALTDIRSTAKLRPEVQALLTRHGLSVPISERQSSDEDQAPVTARVSLKALEADAFLSRLAGRERDVLLAVDHITDPRNLGAIVRSAAFFGVREVIAPERRQVLLTQSAVNTAQGGFAMTELVCVVNLARQLSALKEQGYWIIGTAMDGEPYTALGGEYAKVVLVMGSEESGLSRNVRELCDRLAAIPGRGEGLESLNVSVAAGIMLADFTRPRAL